jgi:hypothetical protein
VTKLVLVTIETLDEWWPKCEPFLDEATKYSGSREAASDVYNDLFNARKQLWLAHEDGSVKAVMVTQILQYPAMRILSIGYTTGSDREDWIGFLWYVEEQARRWGCRKLEGWMRPGWKKVLKGWKHTHVTLEKELWAVADQAPPP